VSAHDRLDFRIDERVEDRIDLRARNAEDVRHALLFECSDDEFRASAGNLLYVPVHRGSPVG
jgi:hypothetical protein